SDDSADRFVRGVSEPMAAVAPASARLPCDAGDRRALARGFPGATSNYFARVPAGARGVFLAAVELRRGLLPWQLVEQRGSQTGGRGGAGFAGAVGSGAAAGQDEAIPRELAAQPRLSR